MAKVTAGSVFGVNIFCQIVQMYYVNESISIGCGPGYQQQPQVSHSRAPIEIMLLLGLVKTRAERRRKASQEAAGTVERETHTNKSGYLKYWNNEWKGKRAGRHDGLKECDILRLQEIKRKGSKAKNIGGGGKLFYNGADERKNGIGIVVREKLVESVLQVKRESD